MDDELVVGIDLGTTNSCISVVRNGRIEVIPNREGKRTTLSFVYYGPNSILVGKIAKHEASSNPSNGIYEIKRLIGCLHDDPDIESEKNNLTYNFSRGTNGEIQIQLTNDEAEFCVLPEEICARILHKLKTDAEKYLKTKITKAVVTVPAYFNNNQRAATRDAARIAGFDVIKLANEPSAAALAYIHDNGGVDRVRTILIFDLGGGTFDVSIVRSQNGNVRVLSVAGDTHLGGQDFLNRLVDYVADEIENKCRIQVKNNKKYMWNILNLCEKTKKILTSATSTVIVPEFSIQGDYVELEITRRKFEELNEDLFKETIKIVDQCIKNIRMSKDDIDEILLVGGSSRIPYVEQLLKNYFVGKSIQRNINADEAIAVGAAIEADFLRRGSTTAKQLLVDVLPLSIGTVLDDETIFFNFARNTPLPANSTHKHVIKRTKDRKQGCILSIYEGGDLDCNKNVLLGAHEIKWAKTVKGNRSIEITMQINTCGIIWVTAKGETIKTFCIALNKGRLEEQEIIDINRRIAENEFRLL